MEASRDTIWALCSSPLLLSSQDARRCVTTSDPPTADLPPPLSFCLTVTSPPVGLTLLNKASSKITPSCLSAQRRHKSFIKRRERRADRYQTTNTERDLSECECVCCFIFWLTILQYQLDKDQPRSLTHILILFVPWKLDLLYQPLITYRITHISVSGCVQHCMWVLQDSTTSAECVVKMMYFLRGTIWVKCACREILIRSGGDPDVLEE